MKLLNGQKQLLKSTQSFLVSQNGRINETRNGAFFTLRELVGGAFSDSGWSVLRRDAVGQM